MDYHKYQEALAGKEIPLKPDVTKKNYDWKVKNMEGDATVFVKDGVPVEMAGYFWSFGKESFKVVKETIQEDFPEGVIEFEGWMWNNGHFETGIKFSKKS